MDKAPPPKRTAFEGFARIWAFCWLSFMTGAYVCYVCLEYWQPARLVRGMLFPVVLMPLAVLAFFPQICIEIARVSRVFSESKKRFPTSLPLPSSVATAQPEGRADDSTK